VAHCEQDWYWRVINNSFDLADFDYVEDKQDYVLYLGRIGRNKGVDIAIDATARAGKRLIIAGQGSLADVGYTTTPDHVTVMGYAPPDVRRALLRDALALFTAPTYLEPFGGIMMEAWLSGTATITPDWGACAEFNIDHITGYRCHTMQEFVTAIHNAHKILSRHCRTHGEQFSLERIAPQYEQYFADVADVYTGAGWYTVKETL
jgi:glycosyltransferase involved in cell wall biosynthesis